MAILKSRSGNVFVSVIIILFILSLMALSGLLYWEKEKITAKYNVTLSKYEDEKRELKDKVYQLRLAYEKTLEKASSLEKELEEKAKNYESLKKEYESAIALRKFIEEKFSSLTLSSQKSEEKLLSVAEKLEKGVSQLNALNAAIARQVRNIGGRKIRQKKKAKELPEVVIKEEPVKKKAENVKKLTARLMTINREYNFVTINKGLVDGIKIGDIFSVVRDGEEIAQVKVSEIRDFVSLALVINIKHGIMLKEGDKAEKK